MKAAQLILVLNAHLPFIRHPEGVVSYQERWFFEALSETYLPFLRVFHQLEEDSVPFRLTISFSPTLVAMMTDPLLQERYLHYLDWQLELAEKELVRTQANELQHQTAKMYQTIYQKNREDFHELYQGNILRGFLYFQKRGFLEIITTAATHAFLPLYQAYPEAVNAQIQTAIDAHKTIFSQDLQGLWIPECAYYPGLEDLLKHHDIKYFFSSTHSVLYAKTFPRYGTFAPIRLKNGVLAFPREIFSSYAVWSEDQGYAHHPDYRDSSCDIGFELDDSYLQPYTQDAQHPIPTGFKYHAITGKNQAKQWYNPEKTRLRISEHARQFLDARLQHANNIIRLGLDRVPFMVIPFNATFLGHWWFEGIQWIDALFRLAVTESQLEFVTPDTVLNDHHHFQETEMPFSSWSSCGYAEVWLDGCNDWVCRHTLKLVKRMKELANRFPDMQGRKERALNQAAREVLLAQASDWPLMMKLGSSAEYATYRVKEHISNFTKIYHSLSSNTIDLVWLTKLEKRHNLFPNINYRIFKGRS